ncbi:MAG: DNA translocase FtsK 4TM domain-containing protein [Candidatus Puniceispirillales bacterium]
MAEPGEATPFFSDGFKGFLRRRLDECIGLVLIVAGTGMLVLLISHDPADPSSHTVTSMDGGGVSNLLGPVGAEIATRLINLFGKTAAVMLGLVPLVWGIRAFRHRLPQNKAWRIGALIPAMLLLPFAMTTIFGETYGGASGAVLKTAILAPAIMATPLPSPLEAAVYGHVLIIVLALAGLGFYAFAAAIGRGEVSLLPWLLGHLKGLAPLLKKPIATASGWMKREAKRPPPAARKRKAPGPRREPVIITSAKSEEDNLKTTSPKRRKSATVTKQRSLDLETQGGYRLPPAELLSPPGKALKEPDAATLDANSRMLEATLAEFGVRGEIQKARFGPVVTRYELVPAPGTKTQRVIGLADDIARSMSALSVRVAVVPGQNVIGIELPNRDRQMVLLRDIFDGDQWAEQQGSLPIALGMDIAGHPVITDMVRMPHLLVAGTTGSGKSVGINGMILSLLYTHTPETCRMIMIDPKMLELSVYDGIPHLLTPVVTDPGKAVTALKWTVREMETRYHNMSKLGVRNIDGYNKRLEEARRKGEQLTRRVQTGFDAETGKPVHEEQQLDLNPLPYIVVVIDEVADLMLVAGKDIEAAVQRLAQMARAAGIHVVMATQRPSVDVITGTIKANFPTRISYQVTSKIDSRTILGEQGAEQLLGKGDMLFMEGGGRIIRVHAPFVHDGEVEAVASFLRQQGEPVYDDTVTTDQAEDAASLGSIPGGGDNGEASLYDQAVQLVIREQKASTSFIQRHLRIGYNRAATIIEDMERNGVVSPANHAGKREVLIDAAD